MRVADRIFAPHYAAPLPRTIAIPATLTATKDGETAGELAAGDVFEVLEITADHAWGVAQASGRVGFVALSALAEA